MVVVLVTAERPVGQRLSERWALEHASVLAAAGESVRMVSLADGYQPTTRDGGVEIRPMRFLSDVRRELSALKNDDSIVVYDSGGWPVELLAGYGAEWRACKTYVPCGFPVWNVPAGKWRTAKFSFLQRRAFRRANRVLTSTRWESGEASARTSSRVFRVPWGVDGARVRALAEQGAGEAKRRGVNEPYVVHLGGDSPNQRCVLASAAASAAGKATVFLGTGVAGLHKPSDHVHAFQVDQAAYYGMLAGADAVLSASVYESHAPYLLDALALGVPFVSTPTAPALDLALGTECPIIVGALAYNWQGVLRGLSWGLDRLDAEGVKPEVLRERASAFEKTKTDRAVVEVMGGGAPPLDDERTWFPEKGELAYVHGKNSPWVRTPAGVAA